MMDEFIQEFLVEGAELLDQLDRDFVELEKNPSCNELLARIFRAIHTLKGTSGTIGLKKIEAVNHNGENILARIREGKFSLSPHITSALLAMLDVTRQLFASLESAGQEGELDCTAVIQSLSAILDAGDKESRRGESNGQPPRAEDAATGTASETARDDAAPQLAAQLETLPAPLLGEILVQSGVVAPKEVIHALSNQQDGDPRRMG